MYPRICVVILSFFLAVTLLAGCGGGKGAEPAGSEFQPQARPGQTWTLAILPFETTEKYKLSGEEVMDLLITELIDLEGYKIIDRESFYRVMNQLGLRVSDMVESSHRTEVSKILSAQLMCFGGANHETDQVTARVTFVETGEVLLAMQSVNKDDVKNIRQIAQKLKQGLTSRKTVTFLDGSSQKPVVETVPSVTVQVKGYGVIIDGDRAMARELALKDAYAKAIEQGCGIKLVRETQVENYQLVKDSIFTQSVGYVDAYEVQNENPDSDLGYEVTVKASVSKQPISGLDKLELTVRYLLAQPRVAVVVEGESKGEELKAASAGLIAGEIAKFLQRAGFDVVDAKSVADKKKELADSGDEAAARLANMLDASVTIGVSIVSEVTGSVEQIGEKKLDFPLVSAATKGVVKIILADSGKVASAFSDQDLSPGSNKGMGNTADAAIQKSVSGFVEKASEKLAMDLAKQLGEPIPLRLELHGVTLKQAEAFTEQLKNIPQQIAIDPELVQYGDGIADYTIRSAVTSQVLQKKMLKLVDPKPLEAEELVLDKIDVGMLKMSLKR